LALFFDELRDGDEVVDCMIGFVLSCDKRVTLIRTLVKSGHIDGVPISQSEKFLFKARINEALGRRLGIIRNRFVITVGHISKESEERRVDEDPAELQDHELMA